MAENNVIEVHSLTKDYGNNKGIFNVDLSVSKGEVYGFLGPNGAGKTTTIRHLMGFISPQNGSCTINGLDCFKNAKDIQARLGYIPGEIALPEDLTGNNLIKFMCDFRGLTDMTNANRLKDLFELDASGKIGKMSKGMKQKVGIVCAFMHNPDVIILDEPSSGLDPLMQNRFIDLVIGEKQKGKTILLSSHIFEEVERTCERVSIIKHGYIVASSTIHELKKSQLKKYSITFNASNDCELFKQSSYSIIGSHHENNVIVSISHDVNPLIKELGKYDIKSFNSVNQSLEEVFMQFYGDNGGKSHE